MTHPKPMILYHNLTRLDWAVARSLVRTGHGVRHARGKPPGHRLAAMPLSCGRARDDRVSHFVVGVESSETIRTRDTAGTPSWSASELQHKVSKCQNIDKEILFTIA